jgi:hypothetical protein
MTVSDRHRRPLSRGVLIGALLALGPSLAGCAGMSDTMTTAFADPAKYELYDCKQLEAERKSLSNREAELQGLMAKAETATGGVVVAELAYRNDYIAVRGQSQFAEEAWRRNKCVETPTPPPAPVNAKSAKGKPGSGKSSSGRSGAKQIRLGTPTEPAQPASVLPKDGSAY